MRQEATQLLGGSSQGSRACLKVARARLFGLVLWRRFKHIIVLSLAVFIRQVIPHILKDKFSLHLY